jgi:hypothetical protein
MLFFFFSISLIPLIRYISATLLTLLLSTVTQQTFLFHHSFKHASKFLPILSSHDPKSDLNSIFFYSTPTPHQCHEKLQSYNSYFVPMSNN